MLTRGALWAAQVCIGFGIYKWFNSGKFLIVGFETLGQDIFTLKDKVNDVLFGLVLYGILYMGGCWVALNRWNNEEEQYKNSIERQSPGSAGDVLS